MDSLANNLELDNLHKRMSAEALEDYLKAIIPLSTTPHVTAARHIITGLASLVLANPQATIIPGNVRKAANANNIKNPVEIAVDWFGHQVQYAGDTQKGLDHVYQLLQNVYEELKTNYSDRTLGQKGMRHLSSALHYCDPQTFKDGVSYAVSVTADRKDRMNESRLDALDTLFTNLHRRAEEASRGHDFYEDVDDDTVGVHHSAQADAPPVDTPLAEAAVPADDWR